MEKTVWRPLFLCLAIPLATPFPFAAAQEVAESGLKNLPFRAIGPAVMGGRIDDVAVDPRDKSVIYVGAASGGLWKTTNRGVTWDPIFDEAEVASIGDIAIAPSNPNIVWVGTGEPNNRQSSTFGQGIYKSTDGGRTWTPMGLRDTHHIGRVAVDPVDPDIVYVAALGHLWGANKERGLFKTTDGGRRWTNAKFIDDNTGFVDVVMDPMNRQVLYAAAYIYSESQDGNISRFHRRTGDRRSIRPYAKPGEPPYRFNWTSPIVASRHSPKTIYFGGNRVFKSTDGGESWTASQDLTRGEDRDKLPIMGALPSRETLARNDGVGAWGHPDDARRITDTRGSPLGGERRRARARVS